MLLYAKNNEGYLNILKLASIVSTSKKRYVSFKYLKQFGSGIIFISAGIQNDIYKHILEGNMVVDYALGVGSERTH